MRAEVLGVLKGARGWMTATEIALWVALGDTKDAERCIRKRIEELKDEGHPIAGLPGPPGPGYRYLTPEVPEYHEARERTIADYKARLVKIVAHLRAFDRETAERLQMEFDL